MQYELLVRPSLCDLVYQVWYLPLRVVSWSAKRVERRCPGQCLGRVHWKVWRASRAPSWRAAL